MLSLFPPSSCGLASEKLLNWSWLLRALNFRLKDENRDIMSPMKQISLRTVVFIGALYTPQRDVRLGVTLICLRSGRDWDSSKAHRELSLPLDVKSGRAHRESRLPLDIKIL